MTSGDYLKALRTNQRLSQRELAQKLGLSNSYLCQIENQNRTPSRKVLMAYAEYFRLPVTTIYKNLNPNTIPSDAWVEAAFEVWQDTANKGYPRAPKGMPIEVKLFALELVGWLKL